MGYEKTLLMKGLSKIYEAIEEIDIKILKGFAIIIFWIVLITIPTYFIIIQSFTGHFIRNGVIFGIWILSEYAYYLGGGHRG